MLLKEATSEAPMSGSTLGGPSGQSLIELGVPTGPLRAPRSNALGFVFQSFVDDLAYAAGADALEFRIALLGEPRVLINSSGKPDPQRDFDTERMRNVLRRVGEISRWSERRALPAVLPKASPPTSVILAISPR